MNKLAAVLLLATMAWGSGAAARPFDQVIASGSLRVAVYRDFPPFASGPDDKLRGVDVDLGAAIAKKLGVKVEYMNQTAGESVDDDLRNAVWKGHYLGGGVADLMLHIPVDSQLALRNDNAVIFAPYYQEQVVVLVDPAQTGGDDLVGAFSEHKVGVELDSLADFYMVGAYGGSLCENVVHFHDVAAAVAAMQRGEAAGVVGTRGEIEGALGGKRGKYHLGSMPMPGLQRGSWPIGMAVKVNAHDLANAIEPIIDGMIKDGSLAKIFAKHGLSYRPAPVE
jgi:ABC-type amino acid transport substrate-binding protein